MKMEKPFVIINRFTGKKIFYFECLSLKIAVEIAVESRVRLSNADLRGANLRNADLRNADLRNADLIDADLRGANLRNADLRNADLRGANLIDADLRNADLRGADLDFSCLPLWCGSLKANFDDKQIKKFLYHVLSCVKHSKNVSEGLKKTLLTTELLKIANEFHRTECEMI